MSQANHKERTVIFVKPESIQRHLIGEFIQRFERRGLKMVACKMIAPTAVQVGKHYPDDESWLVPTGEKAHKAYTDKGIDPGMGPIELAKQVRDRLIEHFADRPLIVTVWEGPNAVVIGRKTAGSTNCLLADVGSIRGDYSMESYDLADDYARPIHTLVHASGSTEEAENEIKIWLNPEDLLDYDLLDETVIYEKNWGKVRR
jgi:nucleoside-diphosphate kinase